MGQYEHPATAAPATAAPAGRRRVAIVGSGFGGLGMAYYLKRAGHHELTIYEKAQDLGGVWRENDYPGAACDVASHLYSFAFEPHYPWSRRYGSRDEIQAYLHHVADKHDLRRHIRFGRELASAEFHTGRALWQLRFADGASDEAEVLITAVGQLHRPKYPELPGLEKFSGHQFHSALWDHDHELRGKSVAVIGTGPSAVQFVPAIAPKVRRLSVYQRSASWTIPKFDGRYSRIERWLLNTLPFLHTLDRWRIYWWYEFLAGALQTDSRVGRLSRPLLEFIARRLLAAQVGDPALRARLTPHDALGCKRILLSNDWLPALARPNVEVVTEAIAEVRPEGIRTSDGRLREADTIIFGTGFASTRFLAPMDIRGQGGITLQERWKDGADAYLGVAVSGFPNLFLLYGPNTNLGAGSIIFMLERQQRYITQLVDALCRQDLAWVEVYPQVQAAFRAEVARRSRHLAYTTGCTNWYLTDGRNTNNWIGYMSEYGWRLRRPRMSDYRQVRAPVTAAG